MGHIDMDRRLAKRVTPPSARYYRLMNEISNGHAGLYPRDGLQLNPAGHVHVARCLEPFVKPLALKARHGTDVLTCLFNEIRIVFSAGIFRLAETIKGMVQSR